MLTRMVSISSPCDPPALASQSAGITGLSHRTRPCVQLLRMCVCVYNIYISYTHIHTYIYTYVYHMYPHRHTYLEVEFLCHSLCVCVCVYVCVCACVCMCICICICICIYSALVDITNFPKWLSSNTPTAVNSIMEI